MKACRLATETVRETPNSRPSTCPVCGGPCTPTRDGFRCARCHFSLCVGCEPGDRPEPADGDDPTRD